MSCITGTLLIDAPASALNNAAGGIATEREYENTVAVKQVRTKEGKWPFVSAQAYRLWWRTTIEKQAGLSSSPVERQKKVAYTAANPIEYWDDDLFGYMRATKAETLTRTSPTHVGTFVSLAPAFIAEEFGVMARHDGDSVPFAHEWYRATLRGSVSIDLSRCGTFSYRDRTGEKNIGEGGVALAQQRDLLHLADRQEYQLPRVERLKRVQAALRALSFIDGGAKQGLHYTDVISPLLIMAVIKGGNNLFQYVVAADAVGLPRMHSEALGEQLSVHSDQLLSDIYVGWTAGYRDEERVKFLQFASEWNEQHEQRIHIAHPRVALQDLSAALDQDQIWS